MAFCRSCGNQVGEDAYVCNQCGAVLQSTPPIAPQVENVNNPKGKFINISIIFSTIAFVFLAPSIINGGYNMLYYYMFGETSEVTGVLLTLIVVSLATTGFILAICSKSKGTLYYSLPPFIVSIMIFFVMLTNDLF